MVEKCKWFESTTLVREWNEMKNEILRHKWIESQRVGRDIGWDRAMVDWMLNHRRDFEVTRKNFCVEA